MSKKDKEIFDSYASGNPNQRFDLIYKNYHTFPKLIDSFETGVFNMILNEREYNRIVGGNMQRKILGKIFLIVIGILFIVVTIFFVMSHKKEMIIEKANKAGLNVEFSGPKIFL